MKIKKFAIAAALVLGLVAVGSIPSVQSAAANLLQPLGARITEAATIIDLPTLGGSRRLQEAGITCFSLLDY